MKEADVTKEVIDYLKSEGWRPVRMNVGRIRRSYRFGETGMCDWLVMNYSRMAMPWKVDVFWLELKAPGNPLRAGQMEWIMKERERGAIVCVADSLESFEEWYRGVFA